jgi:tripartite-type tricarboxylate transporter receptor subunit TctC
MHNMRNVILSSAARGLALALGTFALGNAHAQEAPSTGSGQAASTSAGQAFPAKPVRVIVPTSPGGILDIVTRVIGTRVAELMGQSLVVENRAGASNNLGTEIAARSPADGYTMVSATLPLVVNPSIFAKMPFDPQKDLAPVSRLTASPYVLIVTPSLPAKSVKELIALAKAKPGSLIYSSGGNGTNLHVAAELFNIMAGIKMVHVPYKGGGPALTSVISGETMASFPSLAAILPQVKSGRVRALGITTRSRSPLLPEVPTIAESGVKDYEFTSWVGVLVPAKTPPEIVNALNGWWVKAARTPEIKERFAAEGTDVIASTPAEFADVIAKELVRWAKVVKQAGIKAD